MKKCVLQGNKINIVHKTKHRIYMKEWFPSDFAVNLHSHKNTETFYIRNGYGYFHMDGKIIEIQRGTVIVVPPGVVHGIETFDSPIECIVTIEGCDTNEINEVYDTFI